MSFERPTRSDVRWTAIETLIRALGGTVSEGRGSRVRFRLGERVATFHGPHPKRVTGEATLSIDELREKTEASVDDYLELCEEVGKEPERPYRGEFLVRTTPEVHRPVANAAEAEGVSLNAWVESTLTAVAGQKEGVRQARSRAAATKRRPKTKSPDD